MSGPEKPRTDPVAMAELHERILSEHRDAPHPPIDAGALKAHLLVHGMVEKQLLLDDPPQVRAALERLVRAGLGRHAAIHKIGEVVTREAMAMLRDGRELDPTAYAAGLERLATEAEQVP